MQRKPVLPAVCDKVRDNEQAADGGRAGWVFPFSLSAGFTRRSPLANQRFTKNEGNNRLTLVMLVSAPEKSGNYALIIRRDPYRGSLGFGKFR